MKFVDEVVVEVKAGKGGNGCMSFRRERSIPFGGPNGGNGGKGGSVYLVSNDQMNTLVDYRHVLEYRAQSGQNGMGSDCTGRQGEDLVLPVPVGTMIFDDDTGELIADLATHESRCCVAQGGDSGFGNAHFKSSTNRAPRKTTLGRPGEERRLRLELKILADVGLLGLPNAGKSTFIRAVSAARPKVADYPFTTLYPELGVVKQSSFQSFVIADIPGLIEGAAEGHGLGVQFLRHLSRTGLLLHILDISPFEGLSPAQQARVIEKEIAHYDELLAKKPRWLVLNKIDLLPPEEIEERCQVIIQELDWKAPYFVISGLTGAGTELLCRAIMAYLNEQ